MERFSRDVNDVRFAQRILEARRWIDEHDFRQAVEQRLQETIEERLVSFRSQLFDKAASYNNIVVTLGYAGFFAIWNFTNEEIHRWDSVVIACLLGFSLLVFVFWILRIALANAVSAKRIGQVFTVEYEDRQARVDALVDAENKNGAAALRIQRWWLFIFVLSVGPAFLAGLMLLSVLFASSVGFEFSFFELRELLLEKSLGARENSINH